MIRKDPGGLKRGLDIALKPLNNTLRLGICRFAKVPANTGLAAKSRELRTRGPFTPVKGPFAIPNQGFRQCPKLAQAAGHAPSQIGGSLRKDQGASTNPGVAKATNHDVTLAGLGVTDRDLLARTPNIELANLTRGVGGALKSPRREVGRPQLTNQIINNRLLAGIASLGDPITNHSRGDLRVTLKEPNDLIVKRIKLRGPPRPLIRRRAIGPNRPPDRVPGKPCLPCQPLYRDTIDQMSPSQLRPLLHV